MNTTFEEFSTANVKVPQNDETISHRWYILRYKVMTSFMRDYINNTSIKVFYPFYKAKEKKEKPVIPGYVFVYATLNEAITFSQESGLFLWRKHNSILELLNREQHFYFVYDQSMKSFMKAVEVLQNDFMLFDATGIDVEQNDEVEFITGPMIGQHGYVRTESRKSGGVVIVPVQENEEQSSKCIFYYGIKAKAYEYRIVKFANNTRNGDSIKRANAKAKKLLKDYREGRDVSEKDCKKLKGYILRYSSAKMNTDIQTANLHLLLYRIYTILETPIQCSEVLSSIGNMVIPAFKNRIANARGEYKQKVMQQKRNFEKEIEYIGASLNLRHENISKTSVM